MVFLAAKSGLIKNAEDAADVQNCIICVEMLMAAIGHFFAFPYKEYAGANIGVSPGLTGSLAHALKLNDFYHDTVHQVSYLLISTFISDHYFPIPREVKWPTKGKTEFCLNSFCVFFL